jgi:hypothetical protein
LPPLFRTETGGQNYDNKLNIRIMKRINYQHGLWVLLTVGLLALTLASCDGIAKKRAFKPWSKAAIHTFPNNNWAFEEEVLDFSFDIVDTATYFDIALNLLYDSSVVTLKEIPLTLTLTSPDGMKAIATSQFLLDPKVNKDIHPEGNGNKMIADVVVYPHRKLKTAGTYTLTVYRRAEKADNYGFISLATKVTVSKEQK